MSNYIMLANWTDQGIRAVKDSPSRLDAAKKLAAEMGGELQSFFLTMGGYDMVAVFTAPDDEAATRFVLQLGKGGNVRTQTLRAFDEAAYRELIGKVK